MIKKAIFLVLIPLIFTTSLFGQGGETKKAKKLFDRFAYYPAIKEYRETLMKSPGNKDAMMGIAECYRLTNNSLEAENWYGMVTKLKESKPIHQYYYAQQLLKNGNIESAKFQFEKFLEKEPGNTLGLMGIKSCDNFDALMRDSSLYKIDICDINTPEADFGPSFYLGNVIFASARKNQSYIFNWTGRSFLDLYSAEYEGKPMLENATRITDMVNSKYHEAITTYSPNGDEMYFTRNNYVSGKVGKSNEGVILLKTYQSKLINGKWKKVTELRFNSDEYSVGHPHLSPDGNLLYFVSDMPGGEGGTDIYVSERGKYDWLKPRNLGPKINSAGNEMFPTVTKDGKLYFATDGQISLGGLDIFEAKLDPSYGSTEILGVKNLGFPINSSQDDFGLIIDDKRGIGFFTSHRFGGMGDDDIYSVILKHRLIGKVIDEVTQLPIEGAYVKVLEAEGSGETDTDSLGIFKYGMFPEKEYYVSVEKEGYVKKKVNFSTAGKKFNEETAIVVELERAKDCDPAVALEVKVTERESGQPNQDVFVRVRTEEIITIEDASFLANLVEGQDYEIIVEDPEGLSKSLDLNTTNKSGVIPLDINLEKLKANDVFFIIYYNYDRHNIRSDASTELDRVAEFMKSNTEVNVAMKSHTDSRGSNSYNERLSRNRAMKSFKYLVSKGIAQERLTYSHGGENELTNKCSDGVDCSEEEHQLNRRTEFKIIK